MKIVIYGAAGIVGRGLRKTLAPEHDLVLVDRVPIEDPEGQAVVGDVCDPAMFHQTARGADGLVYLPYAPYDSTTDAATAASGANFDVNTRGIYYCLAAAREYGVARVVYTSSLSVYPLHLDESAGLSEETPPDAPCQYGLTKLLGEEVCRYFARRWGMAVVVLRLCAVREPHHWTPHRGGGIPRTHTADVGQAIGLSLTVPLEGFELFHIFGDRPTHGWRRDRAEKILGFVPEYQDQDEDEGG